MLVDVRVLNRLTLCSKGIKHEALTKFRMAYFPLLLCGRAWELLTNSPGRGRDFMSEIGLVQAAMKEVDKICKAMLNYIVSTETVIFSDLTH